MRRRANTQSNSEMVPAAPQSGLSKQAVVNRPLPPAVLKYPELLDESYLPAIKDSLVYVIKPYKLEGISLLVARADRSDETMVLFSDWNGTKIDLLAKSDPMAEIANRFLSDHLQIFINFMKLIKIKQAQYFFSGTEYTDMTLVDVQTSLNKMCGPGMLRDLFSKIIKTQEVLKIEPLDERAIEAVKIGNGMYEGDIIIKPSRFRHYHDVDNNIYTPLYIKMKR